MKCAIDWNIGMEGGEDEHDCAMVEKLVRGRKKFNHKKKSWGWEKKMIMSKCDRHYAKQKEMNIVKMKRRKRHVMPPYFRGIQIQKLLRKMKKFFVWMNKRKSF